MKRYILTLTLAINLFGLEVFVNSAVEDKKPYSILHLMDEEAFNCSSTEDEHANTIEVTCTFKKVPNNTLFNESKSQFFTLKRESFGGRFLIRIIPTKKAKLYQANFDLKKSDNIDSNYQQYSTHWFVIGYSDYIPFLKKPKDDGINFPVSISSVDTPFIGPLDINKNPIFLNDRTDVTYYLDIKKDLQAEEYKGVVESVDEILREYPNTMFKSDFVLYKLRALANIEDMSDELIEIAKVWIKQYSSNEAIPEVLLLMAKGYLKLGINSEAEYFFDRIITEHFESKFAKLALVHLGDDKFSNGATSSAVELYEKALYSTKDVEVATIAALRLATLHLRDNKKKLAKEFYDKVINANMPYIIKDDKKGYELAKELGEKELFSVSKKIGLALLEKIDDNRMNDLFEPVVKDTAYWLEKDGDYKEAYELYHKYLNTFAFGDFTSFVELRLDNLFFEMGDSNVTKTLAKYDELMEQYAGGEIANKALYKKVKLFLDLKRYEDVLSLEDKLADLDDNIAPDKNETIITAVTNLAINRVEETKCRDAMKYIGNYGITLSEDYDKELAYCAINTADYDLVIKLSERNLDSKNLNEKLEWMMLYIKALTKVRDYYKAIDLGRDILKLSSMLGKDEYKREIYYSIFEATKNLKKEDKLIEVAREIEEEFEGDFKNIDIFKSMIKIGTKRNDDMLVSTYAKKIIDLQNKFKSFIESPQIELLYIQSLMDLNKLNEVIEFSKKEPNKLTDSSKIRFNYLLGVTYQKLNMQKEAKAKFSECTTINADSSWKKLCQEALKLMNY